MLERDRAVDDAIEAFVVVEVAPGLDAGDEGGAEIPGTKPVAIGAVVGQFEVG